MATQKAISQVERLATNQAVADNQASYGLNKSQLLVDNAAHLADTSSAHTVAGLANFASALKMSCASDVNKAHGNEITLQTTGLAAGDQIIAVLKDTTPNWTWVDPSDCVITATNKVTMTATDLGANDGIIILYLDLT